MRSPRRALLLTIAAASLALTACTSAPVRPGTSSAGVSNSDPVASPTAVATSPVSTTNAATPTSAPASVSAAKSTRAPKPAPSATTSSPTRVAATTQPDATTAPTGDDSSRAPVVAEGSGPVIVLDPGHSPTVHAIDPKSGLDVSDYENEPEMRDVYAVALIVRAKLVAAGYRVLLTKPAVDTRATLAQRAAVANDAHAALALSIHDQAGADGGLTFDQANNNVYYQSVGTYRERPDGAKVYFTDSALAALSKRYGQIFADRRAAVQGARITLLGDTGYDLGSRGLPAGDIWIVQLLSRVPWIYNEAGGNSPGQVGLDAHDKTRYADGLVASVEACVPAR